MTRFLQKNFEVKNKLFLKPMNPAEPTFRRRFGIRLPGKLYSLQPGGARM